MPYDEDTLNRLEETRMTGRSQAMTEQKTITATSTIEVLREIVAEFGPDTKRECQYVEYPRDEWGDEDFDAAPIAAHCIVGVFLHRQGVGLDVLEGFNASRIIPSARGIEQDTGVDLFKDPRVLTILDEAQSIQDMGGTWGRALAGAERVYAGEPSANVRWGH